MFAAILHRIEKKIDKFRYQILRIGAERPKQYSWAELQAEGYHSQFGQDKWVIEKLLPNKADGVFVDIGANDGVTLSNTYKLEQIGWNGIAVEPVMSVYDKLVENRKCIAVNGCVASKTGKQMFRQINGEPQMLSGLIEEFTEQHLDRVMNEIVDASVDYEDIEVDCFNLNELLNKYEINQVDFLSIDVEGGELRVLEGIDFSKICISVIAVENDYRDYRIPYLLKSKGYKFHSILGDEFYVKMT